MNNFQGYTVLVRLLVHLIHVQCMKLAILLSIILFHTHH